MNPYRYFKKEIEAALAALAVEGELPHALDHDKVACEPPRDEAHGDIATNAAMVLSKQAGMKPRELAGLLVDKLAAHPHVAEAEIAGPGFINLRVDDSFWHNRLKEVLRAGTRYGTSDLGQGAAINVEYVSANPTGPMHVGHGRGAVVGDVLASLLAKMGWKVTREYYVNDAGAQVLALARSVYQRYRVACGAIAQADYDAMKEAGEVEYGGDYLIPVAEEIKSQDGDVWLSEPEEKWLPAFRDTAVARMMDLIRKDLAVLGIHHDLFTSERRDLIEKGKVESAFKFLESKHLVYVGVLEPPKGKTPDDWEPRPQTLFKASEFGDDVDRALMKSDGAWTYFASDIAYHWDKVNRGFPKMIDVWGADHGGYVKRVQAAIKAMTDDTGELDVKLCNMVKLLKNGEPVKMSKRAGTFVTLREVVDEVGKDVVRFMMLTRRNDQGLDFDLAKVLEQSRDNPVFYVQYAHARCHSVLRHAAESVDVGPEALLTADLSRLVDPAEVALIKLMATWPRVLEGAAEAHEPHRLAYFLGDLAAAFHGLWNKGNDDASLRFLIDGEPELTQARLALVKGVATVIASGLDVFGVEPVEEMR